MTQPTNQTICIHGRQPALGIAELESLYGSDKLRPFGQFASVLDVEPHDVPFQRLGGTTKVCKLLTYLPTTDWRKIVDHLTSQAPQHAEHLPDGKLKVGLSVYGIPVRPDHINASGLAIKKAIKATGRSVRIVPNKEPELNAAQVLYNQLTGDMGWELVVVCDGTRTALAQTVHIQDIDAYAARDQARPKRDARVGMLPPKLAQIIINLAGKHVTPQGATIDPEHPTNKHPRLTRVLDPFCGTGVVLQEALLMGYDVVGVDLEPRMIEYSQTNLDWLSSTFNFPLSTFQLEVGDATSHTWPAFDIVACETYLGRPFSAEPKPDVLREVMQDVDTIHRKFLQNLARQTSPGFTACIAVPAWKTSTGSARAIRASTAHGAAEQRTEPYMQYGEGVAEAATKRSAANKSKISSFARNQNFVADRFWHLPVLDSLEELGYTRKSFVHVSNNDLLYHRPDQIVARELVVLERK